MVKDGSAAFQWAANIFVVPLSNLIFGMSIMPASAYQPYTWFVILGFVLVSAGVTAYGVGEHYQSQLTDGQDPLLHRVLGGELVDTNLKNPVHVNSSGQNDPLSDSLMQHTILPPTYQSLSTV